MAKIPRATHKILGRTGSSDNFAQFGSLVAAAPLKTKDIATIQALPAWDDGFQSSIYGANKDLLLQDLNSAFLEHSTQIAYILQAGIAEWDSATEYDKGSFVQRTDGSGNATGQVYKSLIDANVANAPPANASDANWLWVNPPASLVGASATLGVIPKVSNAAPSVGVPGSSLLADSLLSDDGTNIVIGGAANVNGLKFPDGSVQLKAATSSVTAQSANLFGSTRALATNYYNTTSKPIFVVLTGFSAGAGNLQAYVNAASSPTTPTQLVSRGSISGSGVTGSYSLFLIVLPGFGYRVEGSSVDAWTEWT